jgi:hypothetical protein
VEKLAGPGPTYREHHQFRHMTRNFFARFFESDVLSPQTDFRATLSQALGLLAAPGLIVSLLLLPLLDLDAARNWPIELISVLFSILVMGVLSVLEWDALMLDQRDQAILMALPVRPRTIFVAKFAALALFLVIFSVDVNAGSILLLPLEMGSGSLLNLVRCASAHAAGTIGASTFTFLFIVSVQGVLINTFGPKWFRRISTGIQVVSILGLLTALFFFPGIVDQMPGWKQENSTIVRLFPPMWFVGLCEVLQGTADAQFHSLARSALYALAAAGGCAVAAYAAAYGRFTRASLEGAVNAAHKTSSHRGVLHLAGSHLIRRFAGNPVERATFRFTLLTILRSPKHRLIMAAYVGTGLAIVLVEIVALSTGSGDALGPAKQMALLSLPLVISFFLLSGMRFVFNIPCELSANWVFQMTEHLEKRKYVSGVRKCMLLVVVAPLAIIVLPVYSLLFGPASAIVHTVYCSLLSLLMIEALTFRLEKVPFACSYAPGKVPVVALLCGYWLAFMAYTDLLVLLEYSLLRSRLGTAICLATPACVLWSVATCRRRATAESSTLVFYEEPEPVVRTLGLSV